MLHEKTRKTMIQSCLVAATLSFLLIGGCRKKDIKQENSPPGGGTNVTVGGLAYGNESSNGGLSVVVWEDTVARLVPHDDFSKVYFKEMAFSNEDIYVVADVVDGDLKSASSSLRHTVPSYWKNGKRTRLTDGSYDAKSTSLQVVGNDVYVVGREFKKNKEEYACYWKNGVLVKLVSPGYDASVGWDIKVVGQDVYVAGTVYRDDATHELGLTANACYWKNGNLTVIKNNKQYSNWGAEGYFIDVSGNDVYVTGDADNGIGYFEVALCWKNGVESVIGTFNNEYHTHSYGLWVHNKDAYYLVDEYSVGDRSNTILWKNNTQYRTKDDLKNGNIFNMAFKGDKVYLCGYNESKPAYWEDGKVNYLKVPEGYRSAEAYAIK